MVIFFDGIGPLEKHGGSDVEGARGVRQVRAEFRRGWTDGVSVGQEGARAVPGRSSRPRDLDDESSRGFVSRGAVWSRHHCVHRTRPVRALVLAPGEAYGSHPHLCPSGRSAARAVLHGHAREDCAPSDHGQHGGRVQGQAQRHGRGPGLFMGRRESFSASDTKDGLKDAAMAHIEELCNRGAPER